MNSNVWRRGIAVVLAVALCSAVACAEGEARDDFAIGHLAGKSDAKGNALWIIPGCLCLGVAPIVAVFIRPAPPAYNLVGKPAEYVLGYTDAYKKKARWRNVGWASIGCAASVVASGLVLIISAAAS